jgi:hypothetical protein
LSGTPTKSAPASMAERANITKAGTGAMITARLSRVATDWMIMVMFSSEPLPRTTSYPFGTPMRARILCLRLA